MRTAGYLASLALGSGLIAGGCGDDGMTRCEVNCGPPGATTVEWLFNHYPDLKFQSDTCIDVGAFHVQVEVFGIDDPSIYEVVERQCGEGQATFVGLAPGRYTVSVTPLDIDHIPIVTVPTHGETTAGSSGADTKVTISVPYTAWIAAYTGNFLFRLSWGGASCELAMPAAVTKQTLTLTAGGQVVTKASDGGQLMNGTDPKPCRALTEQFAQYVEVLPFGPATLEVVGTDETDVVQFQQLFDTFVGVGINNPTITFDVAAVAAPKM